VLFGFFCLFYYCGLFIFYFYFYFLLFFLYCQLFHHHFFIPTFTPFTLPPSVLKSLAFLPTTLSTPSHPLDPPPSPSPLIHPWTVTKLPLPHTHSQPADQPTIPTLHNPNPLQSLTQAYSTEQKKTQTHRRTTKTSSPCTAFPTHPSHFPLLSLVLSYPIPHVSIDSLTNVNPPAPTAYRYYHQGVFYITYKLLVRY
jgi:hypothetical protein